MLVCPAVWGSTQSADPFQCLAQNIYFEARGEGLAGRIAVAIVTLNRVADTKYPNTICEVVWQPYQFSWTKDGLSDTPIYDSAWADSKYAADIALDLIRIKDATHYHKHTIFPKWAPSLEYEGYIEKHLFYKNKK